MQTTVCSYAGTCSGCSWIDLCYEDQIRRKIALVRRGLSDSRLQIPENFEIVSIGAQGLRDRMDMTLSAAGGTPKVGLYDRLGRELIDIGQCPALSENLHSWYVEFRTHLPNIQKGSFRLRVSPQGKRGVWCDLSNLDIKNLLDDGNWLQHWMSRGVSIEMGQRRKATTRIEERIRLIDPQAHPWFETYVGPRLNPAPLSSLIGSFTQPGFRANRVLVGEVMKMVDSISISHWLELGPGIGNFTLPLLSKGYCVTTIENDHLANSLLASNVAASGFSKSHKLIQGDFHRYRPSLPTQAEGVLCDPPRSGLGSFTETLGSKIRSSYILYVSCFLDSFLKDACILQEHGYKLRSLRGVDQFPQTPHLELIGLFSLPNEL